MMKIGTSLPEALDYVAKNESHNGHKRKRWEQLGTDLASGIELGEALPRAFPALPAFCIDRLRQAQREGDLATGLQEVGGYLADMQTIGLDSNALKRAMFYPVAVIVIGVIVVSILMVFVIPQYQDLFMGFGADLPELTQMVVGFSRFLGTYWWIILLLSIGLSLLWRRWAQSNRRISRLGGELALRLPWVDRLYREIAMGEFAHTMAFNLAHGKTLQAALDATSSVLGSGYARDEIAQLHERIASGKGLAEAMSGRRLFSEKWVSAVAIGERRKILPQLLADLARRSKDQLADPSNLTKSLEPIVMVILGVIVGFIVVAMYLPIFALGRVV